MRDMSQQEHLPLDQLWRNYIKSKSDVDLQRYYDVRDATETACIHG